MMHATNGSEHVEPLMHGDGSHSSRPLFRSVHDSSKNVCSL